MVLDVDNQPKELEHLQKVFRQNSDSPCDIAWELKKLHTDVRSRMIDEPKWVVILPFCVIKTCVFG